MCSLVGAASQQKSPLWHPSLALGLGGVPASCHFHTPVLPSWLAGARFCCREALGEKWEAGGREAIFPASASPAAEGPPVAEEGQQGTGWQPSQSQRQYQGRPGFLLEPLVPSPSSGTKPGVLTDTVFPHLFLKSQRR